jgi:hypothetical protein
MQISLKVIEFHSAYLQKLNRLASTTTVANWPTEFVEEQDIKPVSPTLFFLYLNRTRFV